MATTIPDHFTTEWGINWDHTSQQMDQRLAGMTRVESVNGESRTFNRINPTSSQVIAARLQDTRDDTETYEKRWVMPTKNDAVTQFDEFDEEELGVTVLPTSPTLRSHMAAYYRDCDKAILTALGGSSNTGADGSTAVPLPGGQKILSGGSGMTLAKLIQAKDILGSAEAFDDSMPGQELVFVHHQSALTDMLSEVEVTSADYASIKALIEGTVNYFMGFRWVRSEQIVGKGTTDALCYAYVSDGVVLGKGSQSTRFSIRDDKNEAIQIRTKWRHGATRLEEVKVVEIAVDDTV